MRRLMMICLSTAALLVSAAGLTGCIVVAPRHHYERVWVPGYWSPGHVWVEGRYR